MLSRHDAMRWFQLVDYMFSLREDGSERECQVSADMDVPWTTTVSASPLDDIVVILTSWKQF